MDMFKQLNQAVNAAFGEFKKEFGQDAKLGDGDQFVTVFNNAALVVSLEGDTLRTEFIGGKPYRVDMTLAIYESECEQDG